MRGAAITAVVAYHYFTPLLPASRLTAVAQELTRSGVDLFFVLSGYLLGGILLANRESPAYFRTFYWRRACRILPLYGALLAIAVAVALTGLDQRSPVLRETLPWWSYFTLTQNVPRALDAQYGSMFTAATWSLAVEEQFYLILPLTLWLTPPRAVPWLAAAVVAMSPLLRFWTASLPIADPYAATYAFTYGRLDTLFGGVLIAWLVGHRRAWLASRWLDVIAIGTLMLAIGVAAADLTIQLTAALSYSSLAICYAAAIARVVAVPRGWLARAAASEVLRWTGVRAYGIYLFHIAIVHLAHWAFFGAPVLTGHGWQGVVISVMAVCVTGGLAHVSWTCLEAPLIAVSRQRWRYHAREAAALRLT